VDWWEVVGLYLEECGGYHQPRVGTVVWTESRVERAHVLGKYIRRKLPAVQLVTFCWPQQTPRKTCLLKTFMITNVRNILLWRTLNSENVD